MGKLIYKIHAMLIKIMLVFSPWSLTKLFVEMYPKNYKWIIIVDHICYKMIQWGRVESKKDTFETRLALTS